MKQNKTIFIFCDDDPLAVDYPIYYMAIEQIKIKLDGNCIY